MNLLSDDLFSFYHLFLFQILTLKKLNEKKTIEQKKHIFCLFEEIFMH